MKYRATFKINKNIECNSMITTSSHIITCQDKRLHCYNFSGDEIRVWFVDSLFRSAFTEGSRFRQMDSPIRYLKLVGGPVGFEVVLIGLKNGSVYQVFVNNPFPQFIAKQTGVIHCVDMNINRTKVAIVDDTSTLYVYNVRTKELLYQVKKEFHWRSVLEGVFSSGTQCSNSRMEHVLPGYVGLLRRWIHQHQSG